MLMSDQVEKQLPAWKQSLIERRRLQEALEARRKEEEMAQLSKVPQWKREVLQRKQSKSHVTTTSPNGVKVHKEENDLPHRTGKNDSRANGDILDGCSAVINELYSTYSASDEERLLPLNQNPILQQDVERRRSLKPLLHKIVIDPKPKNARLKSSAKNSSNDTVKNCERTVNNSAFRAMIQDLLPIPGTPESTVRSNSDVSENSEEVTYGHGFVSKLLDRFRQLSEKPSAQLSQHSRAHSTDDLLNDSHSASSHQNSYVPQTHTSSLGRKGRAYSMDNLLSDEGTSINGQGELSKTSGRTANNHERNKSNNEHLKPLHHSVHGKYSTNQLNVAKNESNTRVHHSYSDPNFTDHTRPKISTDSIPMQPNQDRKLPTVQQNADHLNELSLEPIPPEDQLPKPNTVLNVRTLFEHASSSLKPSATVAKNKTDVGKVNVEKRIPGASKAERTDDTDLVTSGQTFSKNGLVGLNHQTANLWSNSLLTKKNSNSDRLQDGTSSQTAASENQTASEICDGDNRVESLTSPPTDTSRSDIPKRKSLNLDLSELNSTKSTRKTNFVAGAQKEDSGNRNVIPLARDFTDDEIGQDVSNYQENYDTNGITFSYIDEFDGNLTGDDLSEDDDDFPREGDPSVFRRPVYEFEGAGVVVQRSLLTKTGRRKQFKIMFNDEAAVHEYPSERLLLGLAYDSMSDDDYNDDDDEFDSNHAYAQGSSLASYKSRSVVNNYVIGQTPCCDDPSVSAPGGQQRHNDTVLLRPVDNEAVTWSDSASSDLLF